MKARDALNSDWTRFLAQGPIGIGLDVATTEKQTSNPSAIVVTEQVGKLFFERLVIAFKTSDERVTCALLRAVCDDLAKTRRKPRGIGIDASNERFFCGRLEREFRSVCPVRLIAGNDVIEHRGEELPAKILLGNLYANAYADGVIGCPAGEWLSEDRRLVMREKGTFMAQLGKNGEHGDTFDGGKLAMWCLIRGGRQEAFGASITQGAGVATHQLKNWVARKFGFKGMKRG
jgi:hypothetical protein